MGDDGLAGRRVVVTGGAGFIGSHLTEALVSAGARCVVVDDLSTGSRENLASCPAPVDLRVGDILDDEALAALVGADIVFHLAVRNVRHSIKDPIGNFRVNADATLAVLEAMRRHSPTTRFVYVSSSEVYGVAPVLAFAEDDLPAPTTVYGAGKLAGELVTLAYDRTYGLDVAVIRPFNSFGPRSHFEGDSGEVIPKFVLRALAGRPLIVHGDGTQTRDFTYVRDTARWLVGLGAHEAVRGQVVNVGSGRETSVLELARAVVELTGSRSTVTHVPPRPGDLPRLLADTSKARRFVPSIEATSFEQGLKETIDFFATQDVERLLEKEVERNWT